MKRPMPTRPNATCIAPAIITMMPIWRMSTSPEESTVPAITARGTDGPLIKARVPPRKAPMVPTMTTQYSAAVTPMPETTPIPIAKGISTTSTIRPAFRSSQKIRQL